MPETYATYNDVVSYIKNGVSPVVSFYSGVKNINQKEISDTEFQFLYSDITIDDSFSGEILYRIRFTSTTEFKVFADIADVGDNLFIGDGDIATDFDHTNFISIPSGTFGGIITTGDILRFTIYRSISKNQVISIITDSEIETDQIIRSAKTINDLTMAETELLYETATPIPNAVKQATVLLAVARVYSLRILPASQQATDGEDTYQHRLRQQAKNKLIAFAEQFRTNSSYVLNNDELFIDSDVRLGEIAAINDAFRSNIVT